MLRSSSSLLTVIQCYRTYQVHRNSFNICQGWNTSISRAVGDSRPCMSYSIMWNSIFQRSLQSSIGVHMYVKQSVVIVLLVLWTYCQARMVTLGLLVPHSGSRSMGLEVEITMNISIEKVRRIYLLQTIFHNVNISCTTNRVIKVNGMETWQASESLEKLRSEHIWLRLLG